MTAATLIPPSCASHDGCSSEPLFPIVSCEQQAEFSFPLVQSAMSFDWSDFPVINQYNEDHPVPHSKPVGPAHYYFAAPSPCEKKPSFAWEPDSDDADTESTLSSSFSVSSDEDTDSAVETVSVAEQEQDEKHKKSVSFSTFLEIRSHQVILGDHPLCSNLALELGWEHSEPEFIDFDLFESCRQFQRRHLHELRLSYWDRKNILEQSTGLCESELLLQEQRAWRELHWPSQQQQPKDKAPVLPKKSCSTTNISSEDITPILRKVSSTKTLSALI